MRSLILPRKRDAHATSGLPSVEYSTLLVDKVSVEVRAEAMARAIFDSSGDENENFLFVAMLVLVMGFVIQKNFVKPVLRDTCTVRCEGQYYSFDGS